MAALSQSRWSTRVKRRGIVGGWNGGFQNPQLLSVAVDKAVEAVWRKLEKGERLRVEDFVVLLIATVREIHNGLEKLRDFVDHSFMDVHARIDETNRRIDETNKRIDTLSSELNRRIDDVNKRIDETNKRIDETNKRIDGVFTVLGDMQKTMAGMQSTLLEILKVLAEIQRDVAELKKAQ